jgi:hypothetical protein
MTRRRGKLSKTTFMQELNSANAVRRAQGREPRKRQTLAELDPGLHARMTAYAKAAQESRQRWAAAK